MSHSRRVGWPSVLVALFVLALGLVGVALAGVTRQAAQANVTVTFTDSRLDVSHGVVQAGQATFIVANKGRKQHVLAISGPGLRSGRTQLVKSGKSAKLTVTLRTGAYMLIDSARSPSTIRWLIVGPATAASGSTREVTPFPAARADGLRLIVPHGRRRGSGPNRDARERQRRPAHHLRAVTLLALAIALAAGCAGYALGARGAGEPSAAAKQETGKSLYRKYCGQCHALRAARAVGFGSNAGFGKDGGPSFNLLRVPFSLSVSLMTQASNGHERIFHRLNWAQIRQVARFIDTATKNHEVLAQPTDG